MRLLCLYHIGVDNVYSDNDILLQRLYYLKGVLKVSTQNIEFLDINYFIMKHPVEALVFKSSLFVSIAVNFATLIYLLIKECIV